MMDVTPDSHAVDDELADGSPVGSGELDAVDEQLMARLAGRARAGGLALTGEGGLLAQLTKRLVESALEGEITDHLGYDRHDVTGRDGGNSRNGYRAKTVLTEVGPVQIDVPRDRDGSFEPKIVGQRKRRLSGVDGYGCAGSGGHDPTRSVRGPGLGFRRCSRRARSAGLTRSRRGWGAGAGRGGGTEGGVGVAGEHPSGGARGPSGAGAVGRVAGVGGRRGVGGYGFGGDVRGDRAEGVGDGLLERGQGLITGRGVCVHGAGPGVSARGWRAGGTGARGSGGGGRAGCGGVGVGVRGARRCVIGCGVGIGAQRVAPPAAQLDHRLGVVGRGCVRGPPHLPQLRERGRAEDGLDGGLDGRGLIRGEDAAVDPGEDQRGGLRGAGPVQGPPPTRLGVGGGGEAGGAVEDQGAGAGAQLVPVIGTNPDLEGLDPGLL